MGMNIKIFALFALLMIACAAAASPVQTLPVQKTGKSTASLKIVRANGWCATCVNFVEQALHELIEIIINGGVLGGCGDLCSKLSNHLEATICDLVCDEVAACATNDNAAANITSLTVSPPSGQQGTQFVIDAIFKVTNEIATGEIVFQV